MSTPTLTLAQTGAAAPQILFWLVVIVVAAVVLGIVAWVLRKLLLRDDDAPPGVSGFGLPELRRMRDEGQLTEQEYENAKRLLVARTRQAMGDAEMADDAPGAPHAADDAPPDAPSAPPSEDPEDDSDKNQPG